jgi:glycosyltransferase involved in cell wall biosynthesis
MHYEEGTVGHAVITHQNHYGFDADQIARQYSGPFPSASLLIPYYNARKTINRVIAHLLCAISVVTDVYPGWSCEIILVDDGSEQYPLATYLDAHYQKCVRCEAIPHQGRCLTRNHALSLAKNQVILFIDADVLIHPCLLLHHLALHATCARQEKGCISFSLFDFRTLAPSLEIPARFEQQSPNDWRVSCLYQEEWHGCERDKRFAGWHFRPLADTDMLRQWPADGFYGPWMLPNMVLGGFFAVDREKALGVGGCAPLFNAYAFEETSLVTKLIATFHDYVIPLTDSYALHLEDPTIGERSEMKRRLFRDAHLRYFEVFLTQRQKQL